MSRRIETGTPTPVLGANKDVEDYKGRLIKYIPTEVVGVYIAAVALVPADYEFQQNALWIIFWVCAVLTPIYLIGMTWDQGKGPLIIQVILGTLAFPVWVFAMGGPFKDYFPWYQAWIGSVALILVTGVFGAISPKKGS